MADPGSTTSSPRRVELAAVVAMFAFVIAATTQIEAPVGRPTDWLAFICGGAASLVFVWWRRRPVLVAAVVSIALAVYLGRQYPPGPTILLGPLAVVVLGYLTPRRVAWAGVVVMQAASMIGLFVGNQADAIHLLAFPGWGIAAVLAGQAVAAREERLVEARERTALAQQQAISDERLRIAQDLHDSVAHAMVTINVQSGVAGHLLNSKPEQAGVALEAIRSASRDALHELGEMLGVLRGPDSSAPLAPLAGLGEISELVERARNDGVQVELDQSGDVAAVSVSVGAAAYRTVQEALTNTRRHAGLEAKAAVNVAVGSSGSLHVAVSDDGGQGVAPARPPGSSSGYGLIGMRERVESSGGTLTAEPAEPAGFLVQAMWPERANA